MRVLEDQLNYGSFRERQIAAENASLDEKRQKLAKYIPRDIDIREDLYTDYIAKKRRSLKNHGKPKRVQNRETYAQNEEAQWLLKAFLETRLR